VFSYQNRLLVSVCHTRFITLCCLFQLRVYDRVLKEMQVVALSREFNK